MIKMRGKKKLDWDLEAMLQSDQRGLIAQAKAPAQQADLIGFPNTAGPYLRGRYSSFDQTMS